MYIIYIAPPYVVAVDWPSSSETDDLADLLGDRVCLGMVIHSVVVTGNIAAGDRPQFRRAGAVSDADGEHLDAVGVLGTLGGRQRVLDRVRGPVRQVDPDAATPRGAVGVGRQGVRHVPYQLGGGRRRCVDPGVQGVDETLLRVELAEVEPARSRAALLEEPDSKSVVVQVQFRQDVARQVPQLTIVVSFRIDYERQVGRFTRSATSVAGAFVVLGLVYRAWFWPCRPSVIFRFEIKWSQSCSSMQKNQSRNIGTLSLRLVIFSLAIILFFPLPLRISRRMFGRPVPVVIPVSSGARFFPDFYESSRTFVHVLE